MPAHTGTSTKKPILTDAELKQILAMLHNGQTPSNGVVYTEPNKSGKQGPRSVAYMRGYAVRGEVLAAEPLSTSKSLCAVKTLARRRRVPLGVGGEAFVAPDVERYLMRLAGVHGRWELRDDG